MNQASHRSIRRWSVAVAFGAFAFPTLTPATTSQIREWTDATGEFSIKAEFVKLADEKVHLKRADGKLLEVAFKRLSSADQQFVRSLVDGGASPNTATKAQLTGKATELKNDDGTPSGKKSFPRGIASAFKVTEEGNYITSVRIHGARYGYPSPPKEDFVISLCDAEFNPIAEFNYPYSKFPRGNSKWVSLNVKPTEVPKDFVICLNFNPERTKGVYVSHDAEGESLVGLPRKPSGRFTGGDWMVRVKVDRLKPGN